MVEKFGDSLALDRSVKKRVQHDVNNNSPAPLCRSPRKQKVEIMKAELETMNLFLATTDDASHGLQMAVIEGKGRGIKVGPIKKLKFSF